MFFSINKDIEFDGTNPMNFDWCVISNDNVLIGQRSIGLEERPIVSNMDICCRVYPLIIILRLLGVGLLGDLLSRR